MHSQGAQLSKVIDIPKFSSKQGKGYKGRNMKENMTQQVKSKLQSIPEIQGEAEKNMKTNELIEIQNKPWAEIK